MEKVRAGSLILAASLVFLGAKKPVRHVGKWEDFYLTLPKGYKILHREEGQSLRWVHERSETVVAMFRMEGDLVEEWYKGNPRTAAKKTHKNIWLAKKEGYVYGKVVGRKRGAQSERARGRPAGIRFRRVRGR